MRESAGWVNDQASGLRALAGRGAIPLVTVRSGTRGAGASLVVAGLASGLGLHYRTLLVDMHTGKNSLGSIMGLRVRFDGRSVTEGGMPWSKIRVPVAPQVDYLRWVGDVTGMARHIQGLASLLRHYDLVLVDGGDKAFPWVFEGTVPMTLLVVDGRQCHGPGFALPNGEMGMVVNHVDSPRALPLAREEVRRWLGGRRALADFGGLPLAPSRGSDSQYAVIGMGDLPVLPLPTALVRLQEKVLDWVASQGVTENTLSFGVV